MRRQHTSYGTGRTINPRGYVMILNPEYPNDNRPQYIQEHRLVMAAHLGRPLLPEEIVHHINGEKTDNRVENLQLMTQSEHMRLHVTVDGWSRKYDRCVECGTTERKHAGRGLCHYCSERKRRGTVERSPRVTGAWATKYDCCVVCGTTERRHLCHGLCSHCYELSRPVRRGPAPHRG